MKLSQKNKERKKIKMKMKITQRKRNSQNLVVSYVDSLIILPTIVQIKTLKYELKFTKRNKK